MPKQEPKQEPELSQPDYLKSLNAAQFKGWFFERPVEVPLKTTIFFSAQPSHMIHRFHCRFWQDQARERPVF